MSVFSCTFAFARAVRAAGLGLGQVRPSPIAFGRVPDFASGHVQYHVVTELEKPACLHGQDVLDAEELRRAKRRLIQALGHGCIGRVSNVVCPLGTCDRIQKLTSQIVIFANH